MIPIQNRTERMAAALAHLGALIPLFGLLVPLAIGLAQEKRSGLRFQAFQALAYQLAGMLLYFLSYLAQMVVGMGMMFGLLIPFALLTDPASGGAPPPISDPAGVLLLVVLIGVMLLLFLLSIVQWLGGLVFFLLAGAAGLAVLQEGDFRYPLLGNMVFKWLFQNNVPSQTGLLNNERSTE